MKNCKLCKHCSMKFANTEHALCYAIECKRHGIMADHFDELWQAVAEEIGKECTCFRQDKVI